MLVGKVAMREPELTGEFGTLMKWADAVRKLKVRSTRRQLCASGTCAHAWCVMRGNDCDDLHLVGVHPQHEVLEAFRWRQFALSIPNAAAFEIPGLSKTDVRTIEKICTDGLTDCAMGRSLGVVGGNPAATDAAPADVFLFSSLPTPDAR